MEGFAHTGESAVDNVVIIGGGLAGLFCALKLAPRPVTVLTSAPIGEGASSAWAQGGIAAAVSEGDTPQAHLADTIAAGAGLVQEKMAALMVGEARARIHDLLAYGVPFDRDLEGRLAVGREAAHSTRRVVHVRGDMAGRAIMEALVASVRRTPSIRVRDGYIAEALITEGKSVRGVVARHARDPERPPVRFYADATVITSGGVGGLYAVTTNPPEARGLGLAMAARAGAVIADAEFVQFHPTALNVGRDPAPLVTEALRGEGAILVDREGRRIMEGVDPAMELAPRDIVARAVHRANRDGRGAFIDTRAAVGAALATRFPTVYAHAQACGLNPLTEPMPIAPAEHYHMGGILTDASGRTTLDGLWAGGEVASTGVHGANRLASNSLLEAVVFSARIAEDIRQMGDKPKRRAVEIGSQGAGLGAGSIDEEVLPIIRAAMQDHVGVERDRAGLETALALFADLEARAFSLQARGIATSALMIAASALLREESRGGHYRTDFPHENPALARRSMMTLTMARALAASLGARAA